MPKPIYMDAHATTPVDPRVLEAMLPFFGETFGNPASRTHVFGWEADEAVERARGQVAASIGAKAREIVFTSGATEANNLAIKGVLEAAAESGRGVPHVVTAATEHRAVLDPCRALEKRGLARVTVLGVDDRGRVDPDAVAEAIDDDTVLVSIMMANNEIGTIAPLAAIGALCRERGVRLHTDATQAVGRLPVDVGALGVDLLSCSAHKLYGPKGVGALYVGARRPRLRLATQLDGGGHERGHRSGTLNVPAIVGFGRACELAVAERDEEQPRIAALRDRLASHLERDAGPLVRNGDSRNALAGNLNVSLVYVEAESLLMSIDREIALSSGSACTSATLEPSHVLRAIGLSNDLAQSSIRFGLGRFNTEQEVDVVADRIVAEARRLRALSPFASAPRPHAAAAGGGS